MDGKKTQPLPKQNVGYNLMKKQYGKADTVNSTQSQGPDDKLG